MTEVVLPALTEAFGRREEQLRPPETIGRELVQAAYDGMQFKGYDTQCALPDSQTRAVTFKPWGTMKLDAEMDMSIFLDSNGFVNSIMFPDGSNRDVRHFYHPAAREIETFDANNPETNRREADPSIVEYLSRRLANLQGLQLPPRKSRATGPLRRLVRALIDPVGG